MSSDIHPFLFHIQPSSIFNPLICLSIHPKSRRDSSLPRGIPLCGRPKDYSTGAIIHFRREFIPFIQSSQFRRNHPCRQAIIPDEVIHQTSPIQSPMPDVRVQGTEVEGLDFLVRNGCGLLSIAPSIDPTARFSSVKRLWSATVIYLQSKA